MKMTKTMIHIRSIPVRAARSLGLAALLVIFGLSVGGALAERLEQRASEDRLSIGDVAEQN
jgi:hypothetical protein